MVDKINYQKFYNSLVVANCEGRKGEYKKEILNYKKRGFQKIKVDGKYFAIDDFQSKQKS